MDIAGSYGPRSSKSCHSPLLKVNCTPRSEGSGIKNVAKALGIECGLNLYLNATATMCLVNRRGLGYAKFVDTQKVWISEASKSEKFVTKKLRTNVNPADLSTKSLPRPKIEQLMKLMGLSIRGAVSAASRVTLYRSGVIEANVHNEDHNALAVGCGTEGTDHWKETTRCRSV